MARRTKRVAQTPVNPGLESKLARYLLAGGAVLCAPLMAHADGITYSGVLDEPASNGSPVTVTFLGVGGPSFTLSVGPGEENGNYASVTAGSSMFFVDSNNNYPQAFGFGNLISAANGTGTELLLRTGATNQSTIGFKGGNWPQDGSAAYLGFSFTASSQTYTGWAQIATDVGVNVPQGDGTAELIDYAYAAGTSIDAGDGQIATTPEPSSLSLFAIGGAAALALLRRRRASQAS